MANIYGMVQKPSPRPVPISPEAQQAGYQWGGLGPSANFWDGSEMYWQPTFKAIDNIWNTYDTIPVNRDKYIPNDLNFIAEGGRSANILGGDGYLTGGEGYVEYDDSMTDEERIRAFGTEGDDYFSSFGFENSPNWRPASDNWGVYLDVPFRQWEEGIAAGYPVDDRINRPTVSITDSGWENMQPGLDIISNPDVDPQHFLPYSSVGMHELGGHYYDNVIAGQDWLAASDIMNSYGNLTQEELQEQWMNDPRTNHLNLHDPANTGLRTLLRNRSHHGGVVNPREGFGEYISTALADPGYQSIWSGPDTEGIPEYVKDYRLSPAEKFARAVGTSFRPQVEHENFSTITPELNKTFADSLATFLNSR